MREVNLDECVQLINESIKASIVLAWTVLQIFAVA